MRKEAWKWNTSVISTGEDGGYETLDKHVALSEDYFYLLCGQRDLISSLPGLVLIWECERNAGDFFLLGVRCTKMNVGRRTNFQLECTQLIMLTLTLNPILTIYSSSSLWPYSSNPNPLWSPPSLHFKWNWWITYDPNPKTDPTPTPIQP